MARKDQLYLVAHEDGDHAKVWVRAVNWELATVAAAELWGVPWGKVAAACVEADRKPLLSHICARCGRMFNGGTAILCEACRKAQETEEEQTARRKAAAFRRLYTG